MKRRDRPGKRTMTIDFPIELHEGIKEIADREERDFGSQVRYVMKQWLEQIKTQTKPDPQ
jgi:hypothetical protein